MTTCPPLAVDRLIGRSGVPSSLVKGMETRHKLPTRMDPVRLDSALRKIGSVIAKMADRDFLVWLERDAPPTETEIHRAATIVADRLCGSIANPVIRNAQEKRQLASLTTWLEAHGYRRSEGEGQFTEMSPGTFSFHMNVPIKLEDGIRQINIAVDAAVMPVSAASGDLPLLLEAKSAGDFTNVNKRRKEEAAKMHQLRSTYGPRIRFNLLLCGYFDSGYLGYEAAEGIDWVWEHRIDDLSLFGL